MARDEESRRGHRSSRAVARCKTPGQRPKKMAPEPEPEMDLTKDGGGLRATTAAVSPSMSLVDELVEALRALRAAPSLVAAWGHLHLRVSDVVERQFPSTFSVVVVGSVGAGLATKSSDLDLALVPRRSNGPAESTMLPQLAAALVADGTVEKADPIVTRSKAPSLIKCKQGCLDCDLVMRRGTGGPAAGVAKSALLRAFGRLCPQLQPLVLLVKWWAKRRRICNAAREHVNSFTWTLMVAFFLQHSEMVLPPAAAVSATASLHQQQDDGDHSTLPQADQETSQMLIGFFLYWSKFDFSSSCCSVRLGRPCRLEETPLARSNCPRTFVCEDPIEPDENTARTLAAPNLRELRAELYRAVSILSANCQSGQCWADVCALPLQKKKDLQPYFRSSVDRTLSMTVGKQAQKCTPSTATKVQPSSASNAGCDQVEVKVLAVVLASVTLEASSRAALLSVLPPQHRNIYGQRIRLVAFPDQADLAALPLGVTVALRVVATAADARCLAVQLKLEHELGATGRVTDHNQTMQRLCNEPLFLAVSTAAGTPPSYAAELLVAAKASPPMMIAEATRLVLHGTVAVDVALSGTVGSKYAELIEQEELPPAVRSAIVDFACHDGLAAPTTLQPPDGLELLMLPSGQRRTAHELCEQLGLTSHSVSKGRQGRKLLVVSKPAYYAATPAPGGRPPSRWVVSEPRALPLLLEGTYKPPVDAAVDEQCGANLLKTVRLLRSGVSLPELVARYKLLVRRADEAPGLVQLSYSQTESNMSSDVVQECRGLILDESNNFALLSCPFTKFFNVSEKHARQTRSDLDWQSARVYEKIDGSLLTLYFHHGDGDCGSANSLGGVGSGKHGEYDTDVSISVQKACATVGRWRVASQKLPTASGPMPGGDGKATFCDHFWAAFREAGYALPISTVHCYMFELSSPDHRIVVQHARRELRCLGARDLGTLEEVPCEVIASAYGWKIPKRFDSLRSEVEVVAAAQRLNPIEQEGFVVVDRCWRRLKVKSAGYVAIHHLKERPGGTYTARRLLEIARNNEGDEFLAYFPDLASQHRQAQLGLARLSTQLEEACSSGWSRCNGENGTGLKALLKLMQLNELTPTETLRTANIKDVERALGPQWLEQDLHEEELSAVCSSSVENELQASVDMYKNGGIVMSAAAEVGKDVCPTTSKSSAVSSNEDELQEAAVPHTYANPFSALGSDSSSESDSTSDTEEDNDRNRGE